MNPRSWVPWVPITKVHCYVTQSTKKFGPHVQIPSSPQEKTWISTLHMHLKEDSALQKQIPLCGFFFSSGLQQILNHWILKLLDEKGKKDTFTQHCHASQQGILWTIRSTFLSSVLHHIGSPWWSKDAAATREWEFNTDPNASQREEEKTLRCTAAASQQCLAARLVWHTVTPPCTRDQSLSNLTSLGPPDGRKEKLQPNKVLPGDTNTRHTAIHGDPSLSQHVSSPGERARSTPTLSEALKKSHQQAQSHVANEDTIVKLASVHSLLQRKRNAVAFMWPHTLEGRLWQHKKKLLRFPNKSMLTKRNRDQDTALWLQLRATGKETCTVIRALTWRDLHSTTRKGCKLNINKISLWPMAPSPLSSQTNAKGRQQAIVRTYWW